MRTDSASRPTTATTAAYAELQSEFAQRFFLVATSATTTTTASARRTTYRIAPAVLRAGDRDQAEGELRHRLQGADAQPAVRRLPGLHFFANPNLQPGGKPRLRRRLRAAAASTIASASARPISTTTSTNLIITALIRRGGVHHRTNINVGKAETSGVEAFVVGQVRSTAQVSRRLHLHRRVRCDHEPATAAPAAQQGELDCGRGCRSSR